MTIAPSTNTVPRHVGIILDGNRRFAKRLMLKPWKGHEWGAKKIEHVLTWCRDAGVQEVTLYALSIENFNRPKVEFDELMRIFEAECDTILADTARQQKRDMRMRFIGRLEMLPKSIHTKMDAIMAQTKDFGPYTVNFAIAYGGRAEVIDAVKKIANAVKDGTLSPDAINEEVFSRELYIESEPDLIIRTSGEQRTSGFLLWQGSYAELYFSPKMWPEFEKEDFAQALDFYATHERRFGR